MTELTSEEAIRLEDLFIARCRGNLQAPREIRNHLTGKSLEIGYDEAHYEQHTHRRDIKEIMEENRIYNRPLLDKIPRGLYYRYTVHDRGFFGSKPSMVVLGTVQCEFADFIRSAKSSTPVSSAAIEAVRLELMKEPKLFHYAAVYGLCGFEEEALLEPLSGPNWEMALVTHTEGTEWEITSGDAARRGDVTLLFDPEQESEKLWRAASILKSSEELGVSGGFVILADIAEKYGLPGEIVRKAAEEFCAGDDEIAIEQVDGRTIVKRSRI
jgi:hypothetical protein